MKKYPFTLILVLILSIFSCTSEIDTEAIVKDEKTSNDNPKLDLSEQAIITDFKLIAKDTEGNPVEATSVTIDQENKTITVNFPFDTQLNNLVPIISVSEKAVVIEGDKARDFNNEVVYLVKAENKDSVRYRVITSKAKPTEREALIAFYNSISEGERPKWDLNSDISTWPWVTVVDGKVEVLSLSGVTLSYIPKEIALLTNLKRFETLFSTFKSLKLPPEFNKLTKLESIFTENEVFEFTSSLENMVNLKTISYSGLSSTYNPFVFTAKNLEVLVYPTSASIIPKEIANLEKLKQFTVNGGNFTSLPNELFQLQSIEILGLGGSQLTSIPDELFQLENLETVGLFNTKITNLPIGFASLKNLKSVDIRRAPIKSIAQSLCDLTNNGKSVVVKDPTVTCIGIIIPNL